MQSGNACKCVLLSLVTSALLYTYLNSQPFSLQDAQSQLLAEKADLKSKLDEAQQEQCLRDEEVTKLTEDCKKLKSTFEVRTQCNLFRYMINRVYNIRITA